MVPETVAQRLELLAASEMWQWPEWSAEVIALGLGSDDQRQQLLALELATQDMSDDIAKQVLALVSGDHDEQVRGKAAIVLGPAIEECDSEDYELDELCEPVLSKQLFEEIQRVLRSLYHDAGAPKLVRRRALEASIRSPRDWHRGAIRSAYLSGDDEWQVTAVFCMGHITGFDTEILEALRTDSSRLRFEAIRAAGSLCLARAGRHIRTIAVDEHEDQDLRIAAIEAIPHVGLRDAHELLVALVRSDDEQISQTARWAIDELDMWERIDAHEARLDGPDSF